MKYQKGWKQLNNHRNDSLWLIPVITLALLALVLALVITSSMEDVSGAVADQAQKAVDLVDHELAPLTDVCTLNDVDCGNKILADISAYNTVEAQTSGNPCISASGVNICGKTGVVACPRAYPLGSRWLIDGKEYTCEDRTSPKYDHRFDISFDQDLQGAKNWGVKRMEIIKL